MSVFTKIINGEVPCYKIFEDDLTIAFLALDQVNPGHTLVVPKKEVNHWFDVPAEDFTRVGLNAQKIAKAIKKSTGCARVLTTAVGFEVHHYHLHLIPAWSIADLSFAKARRLSDQEMQDIRSGILSHLEA